MTQVGNQIVPASNDNGLAAGASSSLQNSNDENIAALKQMAEHFGELAAHRTMADPAMAGQITQATLPAIPTTGIAPLQKDTWRDVPVAGGGLPGAGNRREFNKSALINMIGAGVTEAINKKKERDQFAAQRQYEILLTAMGALKSTQPGTPEYQHNVNIINEFFSDEKRVKKLEKILGFDAFDAKKEQQKQQDPEYQALHKAASNVNNGTPLVPGGGSSAGDVGGMSAIRTPGFSSAPGAEAALEQATGTKAYGGTGALPEGMNANAARFFGKLPVIKSAPQYIPTGEDVKHIYAMANGFELNAKDRAAFVQKMVEFQKDFGVQMLKNFGDKEVEEIKARSATLGHQMEYTKAIDVAMIESADKKIDQALKVQELAINRQRLALEGKKFDAESAQHLMTAYTGARDAAMAQTKMSQDKINLLLEARKSGKGKDFDPDKFDQELRSALDEYNTRAAKVDQYSKLANELQSKIYGIGFPSNGADTIKRLEDASGSVSSNGSSSVTKPAAPTSNGSTPSGGAGQIQSVLNGIGEFLSGKRTIGDRIQGK